MSVQRSIIAAVLCGLLLTACARLPTSLPHDAVFESGKVRHVQLYSGKEKVREWRVTGRIELNSGKYYFRDEVTGRVVSITGTIVIEVE